MPKSIPALVTPAVLLWAREQSGYPLERVAQRLRIEPDRLAAWERGEARPTMRQARELARFYRRPFGLFLLPEPPAVLPLAAEYRRLPGVDPGRESPELRLAVRVMSERRKTALALSEELETPLPSFAVSAHVAEGAADVGSKLRAVLGVSVEEQLAWTDEWQAWRRWRQAVEAAGVLAFQIPNVALDQVRGVSLPVFPNPVIGVNTKESAPAARAFTLIHELVHVALARGGDETPAQFEKRSETDWLTIERFAEEAASTTLVPQEALLDSLDGQLDSQRTWSLRSVGELARTFRVTPLAMATRLRSAGAMSWDRYRRWRREWDAYLATLAPRKSAGFAAPADRALSRAGRPFVQMVLEALDTNRITAVDACHYLDLRFDHVEKLRLELRAGRGGLDERSVA